MVFGLAERGTATGPALLEPASGTQLSHAELHRRVSGQAERLRDLARGKSLVMLAFASDTDSVVTYLAALEAGLAVMPLPPQLDHQRLAELIVLYRPEIIAGFLAPEADYEPAGPTLRRRGQGPAFDCRDTPIHPDLALLLSTSGSTGSPKTVRLTLAAVEANARQIVQALEIGPAERAPTTLPLSYSYGLSVLNSHLMAGAAVILTQEGLTSRRLWQSLTDCGATSFTGVPASYQLLCRLDLETLAPPSLTTLTQAGGALAPAQLNRLRDFVGRRGGRLFVMYGQTEATARMAVLPPEDLPHCLGAAGRALPHGRIEVVDDDGTPLPAAAIGHIRYRGPNVMMGYGESRADLALGDLLGGSLDTGDLGTLDAGGVLWITGRHKRMAKINGRRINLDEVETLAAGFGPAAVTAGNETVQVALVGADLPGPEQRRDFARRLGLHSSQLRWRLLGQLPLTDHGKVNYAALAEGP